MKVEVLSPEMAVNDLKTVEKTKIKNVHEKRVVFGGEILPDKQFVLSTVYSKLMFHNFVQISSVKTLRVAANFTSSLIAF